MNRGRSSADAAMQARLDREERMAAQERNQAASETAGALTGMWERTYNRPSLFSRGMSALPVPPPAAAPAPARPGTTRPSTMARDSGNYGPGQRPINNHSKWKSR